MQTPVAVETHIARFKDRSDRIKEIADKFIGKTVVVMYHDDVEGDHIPIGSKGEILGFEGEVWDGLLILFPETGDIDMVYPTEIELL